MTGVQTCALPILLPAGEASDGESSTTAGNTSLNTSSGPDTSYQTASAYGGPSYTSSYTTVDSDWTTTASTESTSTSETSSTTATTTTATGATTEDTAESDSSTGDTGTTTG